MTLNLLFFTVTLKLNKVSNDFMTKEGLQHEKIEKLRDENYLKVVKSGFFW
ncbi:YrzI family small protein [Bacillus sp. AGMB 02131]|uniref:YrzI family small protein n=1 Tax=Peribacillus faecalis TaxID=2772559 RepID=A0A927CYY4_9BACI|nr:YrzI family small protein [Peribacillus faecalis]MBD3108315.1 YrzI family small protein [Peribacillus faecalis]